MFPSLATPGNITRNIVSAVTVFPSLARPLQVITFPIYFLRKSEVLVYIYEHNLFKYLNFKSHFKTN